jgi:Cyclic nucleotide-binding domain
MKNGEFKMQAIQGSGFEWIVPYLIHVGALCYLVCFLFRDQLWLRIFAVLGDLIYSAFYFTAADIPLWSAITYSGLNVAINLFMMAMILHDRRMLPLDDNDLRLYQSFQGMAPGDFRRLRKIGQWHKTDSDQTLATEGEALHQLYYVVDGEVEVKKGDRIIPVQAGLFIGEIAYLKNSPASATVVAKAGAHYISWSHEELKKIVTRHDSLKQSFANLLSADMALKVAKS